MLEGKTEIFQTKSRVYVLLLLVLVLALLLAIMVGAVGIAYPTVFSALVKGVSHHPLEALESIVWEVRLPRALVGMVVGAALAVSGAGYQGLFRNPLADPYLLGVASGAALGATLGMFWHVPHSVIPWFAFVGAVLCVLLTLTLAQKGKTLRSTALILTGVVVGNLAVAISSYIMLSQKDDVRAVLAWTMGNVSFASWDTLWSITPYCVLGGLLVWALAQPLNTLQLGESTAYSLGVPLERLKWLLITASTLITAVAVSAVGIIGFVGLIAPHMARRMVGSDYRRIIPASALLGGCLLLIADVLSRVLLAPVQLPVGIITTALGGVFFLWLMHKQP